VWREWLVWVACILGAAAFLLAAWYHSFNGPRNWVTHGMVCGEDAEYRNRKALERFTRIPLLSYWSKWWKKAGIPLKKYATRVPNYRQWTHNEGIFIYWGEGGHHMVKLTRANSVVRYPDEGSPPEKHRYRNMEPGLPPELQYLHLWIDERHGPSVNLPAIGVWFAVILAIATFIIYKFAS